jgi:hypothetical protein
MSEVGDAPAPGGDTAAAETGDAGGDVVSYEQALAEASKDWKPEGDEPEGEAAPEEGKEAEAKAEGEGDKPKKEPEAKKDEKKDDDKPEGEPSKLFAAIARERRKVKERLAEVEAREKALGDVGEKAKAFDNVRKRIHEDPYGLLMEAGGEALVSKLLEQTVASEKSPAEQRVERLERELREKEARAKQAEEAAMVQRHQQLIKSEVEKAGEKFDLVNSLGEHDAVYQLIIAYHAKHNHLLPVEDAAEIVEKGLTERLSKSKKFGAREAVKPPQARNGTPPPKRSNTTLSSVAAGEVPPADDDGPTDERERVAWALRLANAG